MYRISIISSSVRAGRKSHLVALYLKSYIEEKGLADTDIIDLNSYKFPLFEERLAFQKEPPKGAVEFAERIKSSDGVIIVTPEYNGGYPASLKNVIDLLYKEWYHKPVAISTVSEGNFGGSQVITSLQFTLWKMKALTVPALLPFPQVSESFDENGVPVNREAIEKRTSVFINELLWLIEAAIKMK